MNFPETFIKKLASAENLVFFTGAGISAESGISTFRGTDGIWNKLKPEELANFNAFLKNPDMVWEWYQYRRKIIDETAPNAAHVTITRFQEAYKSVTVITQNVDNLHRRAGNSLIHELHGNIEKNYCIKCRKRYDFQHFSSGDKVPHCDCGGLIRPDIVWFGEFLPQGEYSASEDAAANCDVFFSIGTSAVVYPAAQIPITARNYGRYMVEINLENTEQTHLFHHSFKGKAGEILPAIFEEVSKHR